MDRKVVVVVRQAGLGRVAPEDAHFGTGMFDKFLSTLETHPDKPAAFFFCTEGVKLVCEDSPVVPALKALEEVGVRLLTCGTCLDYYKLKDKVAVGKVGAMTDLVSLVMEADHVVTV